MDSVSVAVGGTVPWSYRCESCGTALLYVVRPGGDGVPESMFCGEIGCQGWLKLLDFPAGAPRKRGEARG